MLHPALLTHQLHRPWLFDAPTQTHVFRSHLQPLQVGRIDAAVDRLQAAVAEWHRHNPLLCHQRCAASVDPMRLAVCAAAVVAVARVVSQGAVLVQPLLRHL